jgi:enoyl-CoA hydratase
MSYETLIVETRDGISFVTINRPDKLNALSSSVLAEIGEAVEGAGKDAAVGAIVITGAGEKAFVAGADILELNTLDAAGGKAFSETGQRVFDRIESCGKPVIAAVNGFCLGGGCELAMACHIRVASGNARFGQPEVNLGLIPGAGGTQRLPRLVGKAKALELILSGNPIDAAEAHRIGLVNSLVPAVPAPEGALSGKDKAGPVFDMPATIVKLHEAVTTLAKTIMSKGPVAVRYAIEAITAGVEQPQADGLRLEANLFGLCFATEDMKEGTTAFKEKRKAAFKGK